MPRSAPKRHPHDTPHADGKATERTWFVKVYRGAEAGHKKYISKTVRGTKKEARTLLNEWNRRKDQSQLIDPYRKTLNDYLDEWLAKAAKGTLGPRSFVAYEWLLKKYVRPVLGMQRLSQITPLDIQGLYNAMKDEQGLSARTVRYTHAVLSSALKQAVQWRMLHANPAEAVKLPAQTRREMYAMTPEEIERFQVACGKDPLGPLFRFMLATGVRPSEALGLWWQDVDLKAGTVTIRRVIVQRVKPWVYAEPKTGNSRRTIALPASTVHVLREHRFASHFKAPTDPVFASSEGRPLDEHSTVTRRFKAVLKAAGLPRTIRLYDLRHTHATLLLAQTGNLKLVSSQLGHSGITQTANVYAHIQPATQREAAEKLDAILTGESKTLGNN
jgi:integrase